MSVNFRTIGFTNRNNIDVSLTVEAPIGSPVGPPRRVPANQMVTVNPGVRDCLSTLLSVDDGSHTPEIQAFAMVPPKAGEGVRAYLSSVEVAYVVGSFRGSVVSRTDE